MTFLSRIRNNIKNATSKRIIYSESEDPRILKATLKLQQEQLIHPILIGEVEKIMPQLEKLSQEDKSKPTPNIEIINPQQSPHIELFAEQLYAKRKAKGMSHEQAQNEVLNPLSFAYLMLNNGFADGSVNGAVSTTAEVVRKAIQIIGLKPQNKLVSSYFIMSNEDNQQAETLIFADCALVVDPNSEQLSEIAYDTIQSAQKLLNNPIKVAMLSFSTQGSAKHPEAEKVQQATINLKERLPTIAIDGEIQFDAAIVPSVSEQKYSQSRIKGEANVFIFPNLSAGNIGYKIAQRLGGYSAIGPILQGLNKPANDLSRGCNVEDIINLSLITAT